MTQEKALLAGGCFWGMEELLRALPGVTATTVGYTGGKTDNPTYETVSTGTTGHAEAIQITFDPGKISYEDILLYFFRLHDPTTPDRQGNDRGSQYRSAIFYYNEEQKETAVRIIEKLSANGQWPAPIVTTVSHATSFYPAEEYHQDYLQKHPGGYTCHWVRPEKTA